MRRLTPRQTQIAELTYAGKTQREIAEELGISGGTVKVHMAHVRVLLDLPLPRYQPLRWVPRDEFRRRLDQLVVR